MREPIPTILLGDRSMFAEGVAATLQMGGYIVERRLATLDRLPMGDDKAIARVLIVMVRYGISNITAVCRDISSIRSALPQAKIVAIRASQAITEEDFAQIEADAYVQCSLEPQALFDILNLIQSGPYKLFVSSLAEEHLISSASLQHQAQDRDITAAQMRSPSCDATPFASSLSKREREILGGLAQGESNKALAKRLGLSEATIKAHVRAVLQKVGAANRTQAAVMLLESGISIRTS